MNKTGTRVLETERLVLRRFVIEDAEAMFYGWCNDPDVTKFLTWPPHESVEVTRYVLNEWIPQYKNGDYFNWAMILKESGLPVQRMLGKRIHARSFEGSRRLSL